MTASSPLPDVRSALVSQHIPEAGNAARAAPDGGAIALHARPSPGYVGKLAATRALLQQAAAEFQPLKQASSLGAEDVVVTDIIEKLGLDITVFVLDTGALHAETLALLARQQQRQRLRIEVWQPPAEQVLQFVGREGRDAMYRSIELRKACCALRKLEPLERALEGQRAWITGLRREQSGARADVPAIDGSAARVKFNPLADWTWGDVWHYIATEGVDYNPLHDRFYPSIGCAPCTRAIAVGEDFRAGRWWWESPNSAKECGLHWNAQPGARRLPATSNTGTIDCMSRPGVGHAAELNSRDEGAA